MPNTLPSPYSRPPRLAVLGAGLMLVAAGTAAMIALPSPYRGAAIFMVVLVTLAVWWKRSRRRWTVPRSLSSLDAPQKNAEATPQSTPPDFDPDAFLKAAAAAHQLSREPARSLNYVGRIAKVQALQHHPDTPTEERNAAASAIDRLMTQKRRRPRRKP